MSRLDVYFLKTGLALGVGILLAVFFGGIECMIIFTVGMGYAAFVEYIIKG